MSVDFLSKNFPPFQVHHAKKPPRFYPDGFQRNVIDFYLFFRIVGSEKPYICSFPILYGPYVDTVGRNTRVIEEYISLAVKSRKMQTTAGKYHFERFVVRRFFAAAVEKQPRSRIASSVPVTTGVPASSPFSRAALMVTHPAISVYQLALSY